MNRPLNRTSLRPALPSWWPTSRRRETSVWAVIFDARVYWASQKPIPLQVAHARGKLSSSALRREWRRRIIDHDGDAPGTGGIDEMCTAS